MQIVTRPDFDGIVCAALLYEALDINKSVKWIEPGMIQKGTADIKTGDILANLPYHKNCSMWFDHHFSNKIESPFEGLFEIAPSAAGLVFKYYKDRFKKDYSKLIYETDKIDSANLSMDEVLRPENYPYIILSMTLSSRLKGDEPYWAKLIDLLRKKDIESVLKDPDVKKRVIASVSQNTIYKDLLKKHTTVTSNVAVTDFRSLKTSPFGNRFLIYPLFEDAHVHIKISFDKKNSDMMIISIGHSIFNQNCLVNVGKMLTNFEGGGHKGAGACYINKNKANSYLKKITDILIENQPN